MISYCPITWLAIIMKFVDDFVFTPNQLVNIHFQWVFVLVMAHEIRTIPNYMCRIFSYKIYDNFIIFDIYFARTCVQNASMLERIDFSVDSLCNYFYRFACRKFLNQTKSDRNFEKFDSFTVYDWSGHVNTGHKCCLKLSFLQIECELMNNRK